MIVFKIININSISGSFCGRGSDDGGGGDDGGWGQTKHVSLLKKK